jgi:dihydroorotate dehydrogenase (fumarate)
MSDLTTRFAGLTLRSPIVAASAPPTESADAIRRCADAGIGAVVTKSIVDYARADRIHLPRRAKRHVNGQWSIQGSFSSETLTLREGLDLFDALGGRIDVPVIASVGVLGDDARSTASSCRRLQEAGAAMIHLDLFYLPHPRASAVALSALQQTFRAVRESCSIPVTAKLNLELPAHLVAQHLDPTLLDGIFVLDSIRVPTELDDRGNCAIPHLAGAIECSLFGPWQKPQTLQYTRILSELTTLPICAGGGLQNAADILESIALGATAVQFATQLMVHGSPWITKTTRALEAALHERGYASIEAFGAAVRNKPRLPETAMPVRAIINRKDCTDCGVCTRLMFCSHISQRVGELPVIGEECYGCGFCVPLCPSTPRAIQMVPLKEPT